MEQIVSTHPIWDTRTGIHIRLEQFKANASQLPITVDVSATNPLHLRSILRDMGLRTATHSRQSALWEPRPESLPEPRVEGQGLMCICTCRRIQSRES